MPVSSSAVVTGKWLAADSVMLLILRGGLSM
jgi:hypothetical protein